MSEWRTQDQIDADEDLSRAITRVLEAYDDNPSGPGDYVLAEYVVITAQAGLSMEKAQHTKYDYLLANGSIPWHSMMGLMAWGKLTMLEAMSGKGEDSE